MISLRTIVLILLFSLTAVSYAQRLQAIHNSADPALDTIDVYISLLGSVVDKVEDVPFRAATSFIDAPLPGFTLDIGIAPGNSTSVSDTVKNFRIALVSGVTYVGLVQGVLNPAQFAPNPDGLDISLVGIVNQNGREISNNPGEVDLFFVNGATDAPTLDVYFDGGAISLNNVPYSGFTDYVSLPAVNTIIQVADSIGNPLFNYIADLSVVSDSAITLFASGFMDPSANQNGEAFGLFAATPGGNVIEFSTITDITPPVVNAAHGYQLFQNYPNPFNPTTTISYQLAVDSDVELTLYNLLGQPVRKLVSERKAAGSHQIQWDGRDGSGRVVASGLYVYQIKAGDFQQSRKMLLLR